MGPLVVVVVLFSTGNNMRAAGVGACGVEAASPAPSAGGGCPGPLLEARLWGADPEAGHPIRFGGAACQFPPGEQLSCCCHLDSRSGEAGSIDKASGAAGGGSCAAAACLASVPKWEAYICTYTASLT